MKVIAVVELFIANDSVWDTFRNAGKFICFPNETSTEKIYLSK